MLDLRRLRLLRELEARGTVHGAARALDYTPTAVSQQLAVLEREAASTLLEHAGRNVRLTDAGRVLVRHAATLLDGMEAAEAELAAAPRAAPPGTVRVATFQSAVLRIVAPAIARARARPSRRPRRGPETRGRGGACRRCGCSSSTRSSATSTRAAARDPRRPARARRSLREQIRLVLPAAHPLARRRRVPCARLADAAWAGCQPGTGHREMLFRVVPRLGGFEPDLRHASDDFLILFELVRTPARSRCCPTWCSATARPASRCGSPRGPSGATSSCSRAAHAHAGRGGRRAGAGRRRRRARTAGSFPSGARRRDGRRRPPRRPPASLARPSKCPAARACSRAA